MKKTHPQCVRKFIKWLCLCLTLQATLSGCSSLGSVPMPAPKWRGLVPGSSTEADVVRVLGTPTEKSGTKDHGNYLYRSSRAMPDKIVIDHGAVKLIQVGIEGKYLKSFLDEYGEPEKITWAFSTGGGVRLFVFARHGVAVVANNWLPPAQASVEEQWYFEPMSPWRFQMELAPVYVPAHSPDPDDKDPEDSWPGKP